MERYQGHNSILIICIFYLLDQTFVGMLKAAYSVTMNIFRKKIFSF